jgi:hypothetical protein
MSCLGWLFRLPQKVVDMPQIWMTYDELAGLLDCGMDEARDRVRREGLDRKQSRDGHTRVKLNFPMIAMFVARIKGEVVPLDRAIEDLRVVHGMMKSYEDHQAEIQNPRADDAGNPPVALAG